MYAWLLAASVAWGAPGEGTPTNSQRPSRIEASEPTPLFVYSRQASELLKAHAVAKTPEAQRQAIQDLCELHHTLLSDERYEQIDKLQDLRGRIYSRLRRTQTELKQKLAGTRPEDSGKGAPRSTAADPQADAAALAASDSLAAGLLIMDASLGAPSNLLARGGRAGPADFGQELVDLIERTINPAFWDTNGGPGTIVYYAPLQCIVVRASGTVHERIGGVVGGLRAAR